MRRLLLFFALLTFFPIVAKAQVLVPVDGSKFYCPANAPGGVNCCTKRTFDSTNYTGLTVPFTGMSCAQGQYFFVRFPAVGTVSNQRNFPSFNITAADGSNSNNTVFQIQEAVQNDSTSSANNPWTYNLNGRSPVCLETVLSSSTLAFNQGALTLTPSGSVSPASNPNCASQQCWIVAKVTRTDGSVNCNGQTDGFDGNTIVSDGLINFH